MNLNYNFNNRSYRIVSRAADPYDVSVLEWDVEGFWIRVDDPHRRDQILCHALVDGLCPPSGGELLELVK